MSELSETEFAERCRLSEVPAFFKLLRILKSDVAAARALRAESKFISAHPELPTGAEFADAVRAVMVAQKLSWNDEGLQKAVELVLEAKDA